MDDTVRLRHMTAVYITRGDQILLLYRIGSRVVPPSWCGVGGHFEKDELNDPEQCVLRELLEETGITAADIGGLKLRYISLRLKNQEVRQNWYYFAELKNDQIKLSECDEGTLEWVNINDILEREMPFSAKECLKHYLKIGKYNAKLYSGAAAENGTDWAELREF